MEMASTPATDLDKTDANKAFLEEMSQKLFIDGDWTNPGEYFDFDNFVQHTVGAGPDGAFLLSLEGQTDVTFYDAIKFIHVLGNFGLIMSEGPNFDDLDSDEVYAYFDLFRMEDGKIVEHWDAIQEIPPRDQWANDNGKWGDLALDAGGAQGVGIVLRNTLQDPGEDEVTYASLFGQADDAFDESGTLSDSEVEFPTALAQAGTPAGDISGLYAVDITETSIEFNALPGDDDPFWVNVFGLFPEGKFDRYYLTFSEPHNIRSAASNHTSANLSIISDTEVVVEISEGYDLQPGVSFFISLNGQDGLTNEQKARGFNEGLESGNPAALKWMRNDYLQHNLTVPTGKDGIAFFYTDHSKQVIMCLHKQLLVVLGEIFPVRVKIN